MRKKILIICCLLFSLAGGWYAVTFYPYAVLSIVYSLIPKSTQKDNKFATTVRIGKLVAEKYGAINGAYGNLDGESCKVRRWFLFVIDRKYSVEEARLLALQMYLECTLELTPKNQGDDCHEPLIVSSDSVSIRLDFEEPNGRMHEYPNVGSIRIKQSNVEYLQKIASVGYVAEPSHSETIVEAHALAKDQLSPELKNVFECLSLDVAKKWNEANFENDQVEAFQKSVRGGTSYRDIFQERGPYATIPEDYKQLIEKRKNNL